MIIPRTFKIGGVTWRVREVDAMPNALAFCDRDAAMIYLVKGAPQEVKELAFCHELMHVINYAMGHDEHDEREIDAAATFLHQFAVTAKR